MVIGALGEGLYLLLKYGMLVAIIVWAFNYSLGTRDMAINANVAINAYMNQGWLPKPIDGRISQNPNPIK